MGSVYDPEPTPIIEVVVYVTSTPFVSIVVPTIVVMDPSSPAVAIDDVVVEVVVSVA